MATTLITPTQIRIIKLDDEIEYIIDAADDFGHTVGIYWKRPTVAAALDAIADFRAELLRTGNRWNLPVRGYGVEI